MNPICASRRRTDFIIRMLCIGAAMFGLGCLALILGATLWFVPHRSQPSGAGTALDNAQAPTVTLSPSVKEEDADGRKQDSLPAPESAPVLDDSVSICRWPRSGNRPRFRLCRYQPADSSKPVYLLPKNSKMLP